ncbi:MAG TPA: response regulator [Fimbriimonadaceae bacterium]|nr:response regulator [Fimbriimonadaceae bacterium]
MPTTLPLVLLVEDNPDDEKITLRALKQSDVPHTVTVARDGAEALEVLFAGDGDDAGETPSLVLLDLKLPKVGGLEILQRMRAEPQTKRIPVVILTSSDEEKDLLQSYNIGANSYIRKPVDYDQYMETIKKLGLYWLTMNKPPT